MTASVPIVLASMLVVALWVSSRVQRAWLGPISIPAWLWVGASILPLLLAPDRRVGVGAWALVFGFAAACMLGAFLGMLVPEVRRVPRARFGAADWRLNAICLLASMAAPILLYRTGGQFASTSSLADVAFSASQARYSGEMGFSWPARISQMFNLFAAAQAGLLLSHGAYTRTQRFLAVAWTLPLVATAFVYTTKAPILFGTTLFLAGWMSGEVLYGRIGRVTLGRIALATFAIGSALAVVSGISMALRYGRFNLEDADYITDKFAQYGGMHMAVLDHWVERLYAPERPLSFGVATFAGPAQLIGAHTRLQGIYEPPDSETSNVYTYVRPLVEDFGVSGAVVFLMVLAALGGMAWQRLRMGRVRAAAMVMTYVTYVAWSPVCSLFTYTTIVGALGLVWLWLCWVDTRSAPRVRWPT